VGKAKYRAFISYSHADEVAGDWLQRGLETWRAPASLVGRPAAFGPIPRKLTPIFRDRADLPASGNLNVEIQAALTDSDFQIVLCTPNAAKSRWVNEEIKFFKKLHGQDRTLAVIYDGEPGCSAIPGREAEECFPPALRFEVDSAGEVTDRPAEPIAADARKSGDGRRGAISKLAAGLLGVRLDDLVQREAHRRTRNAWMWTGAMAAIAAIFAVISVYALQQGAAAKRMRGEAEDLIQFMITDFRDTLELVGRLDLLDKVGERALAYYGAQDETELDADALGRRSRALLLVGEIDHRGNHLDSALKAYEEAAATTEELLRRKPNDPQRIFDHAQSVSYVGFIAGERGDLARAETNLVEYLKLATQLVAIDPKDAKWWLEQAYATSNLGALKVKAADYDAAIPYFEQSVAARKILFDEAPGDEKVALAYAYALSWLGRAELLRGGFARAEPIIQTQLSVYEPILAREPDHFQVLDAVVTAQRRLANAQLARGETKTAAETLEAARRTSERLLARDPTNANWKLNASHIERALSAGRSRSGDVAGAIGAADRAVAHARDVRAADASHLDALTTLTRALARRLAAGGARADLAGAAAELAALQDAVIGAETETSAAALAESARELARFAAANGDASQAQRYRARAIKRLHRDSGRLDFAARVALIELLFENGDGDEARRLAKEIDAIAYRDPDYSAFAGRIAVSP